MAGVTAPPIQVSISARHTALGSEVYRGLIAEPKILSPWLFYDEAGSRLFEAITELPEYYLTRTERALFSTHADQIVVEAAQGLSLAVIELGAGTATKTGLLLASAVRLQGQVDYYPIDVSASALVEAKQHLELELPGVTVHARVGDYTEGLGRIDSGQARRLVLWIGSSIGNFAPADAVTLLRGVRDQLRPGDCLLLGADQVKAQPLLEAAYDDSSGVTAEFNKNVLARINRELGAEFDLEGFAHRAHWNREASRVEMHLVSRRAQSVAIPSLELQLRFREGESIHTENSYKFTDASVAGILGPAGFAIRKTWKDARGWFGVYLAQAIETSD